jgi:hypothetical protein
LRHCVRKDGHFPNDGAVHGKERSDAAIHACQTSWIAALRMQWRNQPRCACNDEIY